MSWGTFSDRSQEYQERVSREFREREIVSREYRDALHPFLHTAQPCLTLRWSSASVGMSDAAAALTRLEEVEPCNSTDRMRSTSY